MKFHPWLPLKLGKVFLLCTVVFVGQAMQRKWWTYELIRTLNDLEEYLIFSAHVKFTYSITMTPLHSICYYWFRHIKCIQAHSCLLFLFLPTQLRVHAICRSVWVWADSSLLLTLFIHTTSRFSANQIDARHWILQLESGMMISNVSFGVRSNILFAIVNGLTVIELYLFGIGSTKLSFSQKIFFGNSTYDLSSRNRTIVIFVNFRFFFLIIKKILVTKHHSEIEIFDMGEQNKVTFLRVYQPFLWIITVYDSDNFRTNDRRVLIRNILSALGVSSFLFIYACLFLPMELYACIEHDFSLSVICREGAYFLCDTPMLIIYGSFWWNREKLIKTIDHLQGIIQTRENRFVLLRFVPVESFFSLKCAKRLLITTWQISTFDQTPKQILQFSIFVEKNCT